MNHINCTLCGSPATDYFQDKARKYFQCGDCQLVFVRPESFLTAADEKSQYDLHQNDPTDDGYRKFLSRMSIPMNDLVAKESHGLDFGSGPGPTLSLMLEELGHTMNIYDPFYATDESVLKQKYDFITATEVVEHFHKPSQSLERIWQCLKQGGHLGIMTKLVASQSAFAKWHYKNDPTHVCFFSKQTFEWLANHWKAEIVFQSKDVIVFQKTDGK